MITLYLSMVLAAFLIGVADNPAAMRGRSFVLSHCASCHAVEKTGNSPNAKAPPFRDMDIKYPVADLMTPLHSGRNEMPKIELSFKQATEIVEYFKTLREK